MDGEIVASDVSKLNMSISIRHFLMATGATTRSTKTFRALDTKDAKE